MDLSLLKSAREFACVHGLLEHQNTTANFWGTLTICSMQIIGQARLLLP